MKKHFSLALIFWFLLLYVKSLFAISYEYHPNSHLRLGAGFDIERPTEAFARCITYTERKQPGGVLSTSFRIKLLSSRKELYESLNLSTNLSGHYLFLSGNASFSLDKQISFHSDSISWILIAESNFGKVEATDIKLMPQFERLLGNNEFTKFKNACGTHFVLYEERKAIVSAIFSLKVVDKQQRKVIESLANLSASGATWNAEIQAKYNNFIAEATKITSIDVSTFMLGGEGIKELAGLISHYDDLQTITNTLSNYVKTLSPSSGVPTRYTLTSMEYFGFPLKNRNIYSIFSKDNILEQLAFKYIEVKNTINRINKILASSKACLKSDNIQYYRQMLSVGERKLNEIWQSGQKCLQKSECDSGIELPNINWESSKCNVIPFRYRGPEEVPLD